jgi:hypothetical protein
VAISSALSLSPTVNTLALPSNGILESARSTIGVAGSTGRMLVSHHVDLICVRDERGSFDQPTKDLSFGVRFESVFQRRSSYPFFACFAQFYLAAPFRSEDLGGRDAALGVGV